MPNRSVVFVLLALGAGGAFGASDSIPIAARASTAWIVAAALGWLLAALLVVYLVLSQRRWRVAFETKEWLLLPSQMASEVHQGIGDLAVLISKVSNHLSQRAELAAKSSTAAAGETRAAREEFRILRDELEAKQKEIKALHLGQEFHYRRPVLMRVIRALEIITDDGAHGRDPVKTLEGIQVELAECLEDNRVKEVAPSIGAPIAHAAGFDARTAKRRETEDSSKRGTVAEVERPAYVVRGPNGHEETLVPARVTVFV